MPAQAGIQDIPVQPRKRFLDSRLRGCVVIHKIAYFVTVMPVPDQVRDDGSGIQLCNNLKRHWIPGQARNDNTATYAILTIATQPPSRE
jgi:hypothetical protein